MMEIRRAPSRRCKKENPSINDRIQSPGPIIQPHNRDSSASASRVSSSSTSFKDGDEDDIEEQQSPVVVVAKKRPPLWVAVIDTDEFITINYDTHNLVPMYSIPDTTSTTTTATATGAGAGTTTTTTTTVKKHKTIYDVLTSPNNTEYFKSMYRLRGKNRSTKNDGGDIIPSSSWSTSINGLPPICFGMTRIDISTTDSIDDDVQSFVPNSLMKDDTNSIFNNGMNYKTIRYKYHKLKKNKMRGKSMIDLSRVGLVESSPETTLFSVRNINVHLPIKSYCYDVDSSTYPYVLSPIIVQQYIGTYEQYTFRGTHGNDPRSSWTRNYQRYMTYNYTKELLLEQLQEQSQLQLQQLKQQQAQQQAANTTITKMQKQQKQRATTATINIYNNNARNWLPNFIETCCNGNIDKVKELLKGIGTVNPT